MRGTSMFLQAVLGATLLAAIMVPMIPNAEARIQIEELDSGVHLGFATFAPVPAESLPVLNELIAEATTAGMHVSRVMVDWSELEPIAGAYDSTALDDQLERVPIGSSLFLTLGVTDTDHYSVPDDLLASDTELSQPLDDPMVIERYLALLDKTLPALIEEHGLFALSVANEPDDLLLSRPNEEATALASFTRAVSEHVESQFSGLPVTLTISGPGVTSAPDFLPELLAATDIAAFNWSCLDFSTFESTGVDTIPDDIDLLLRSASVRDIVIQELSCGSGYADRPSSIGSSPESQAEWFAAFFAAMQAEPQFRAAFVLDLVDWPTELAAQYTDFLRAEGLDEIADRYGEFLATWGLLSFELQPKPAWDVFLKSLQEQGKERVL